MAEHLTHVVRGRVPGIHLADGGGGSTAGNFGPILDDLAGAQLSREIAVGPGIAVEARDDWPAAVRSLLARVG